MHTLQNEDHQSSVQLLRFTWSPSRFPNGCLNNTWLSRSCTSSLATPLSYSSKWIVSPLSEFSTVLFLLKTDRRKILKVLDEKLLGGFSGGGVNKNLFSQTGLW